MAAIHDEYTNHRRRSSSKLERPSLTAKENIPAQVSQMNPQLATPYPSMTAKSAVEFLVQGTDDDASLQISDFFDIPLLISDNGEEDSESESLAVSKLVNSRPSAMNDQNTEAAAQVIKKYIREECKDLPDPVAEVPHHSPSASVATNPPPPSVEQAKPVQDQPLPRTILGPEAFKNEHEKVMKIIVKYVAMKITNSFPPQEPKKAASKDLPLDEFLMVLVSRLQLSMKNFMKGIIYLFRYMDIIYLLRYLNQSNNFANYTDMGFGLKKLIVGCFRLVLARERIVKDWKAITGLTNVQINAIVKTVIGRLNGKLNIKNAEVLRLNNEIYRFIQMVTKSV